MNQREEDHQRRSSQKERHWAVKTIRKRNPRKFADCEAYDEVVLERRAVQECWQ